jgi:hypothetical protein
MLTKISNKTTISNTQRKTNEAKNISQKQASKGQHISKKGEKL